MKKISYLRENLSFDQARVQLESDEKDGGKNLYLKGIAIQGGIRNQNQRVYPVGEITNAGTPTGVLTVGLLISNSLALVPGLKKSSAMFYLRKSTLSINRRIKKKRERHTN